MPQVTPTDILTPVGDLDADVVFTGISGTEVTAQLNQWIQDAYNALDVAEIVETTENVAKVKDAVTAYVSYKAYKKKYVNMLANPLRASVDNEASDEYTIEQVREFQRIANDFFDSYSGIVSELLSAEIVVDTSPSIAVPTEISW
jgi:hypothetical protein